MSMFCRVSAKTHLRIFPISAPTVSSFTPWRITKRGESSTTSSTLIHCREIITWEAWISSGPMECSVWPSDKYKPIHRGPSIFMLSRARRSSWSRIWCCRTRPTRLPAIRTLTTNCWATRDRTVRPQPRSTTIPPEFCSTVRLIRTPSGAGTRRNRSRRTTKDWSIRIVKLWCSPTTWRWMLRATCGCSQTECQFSCSDPGTRNWWITAYWPGKLRNWSRELRARIIESVFRMFPINYHIINYYHPQCWWHACVVSPDRHQC